ncbi:Murein DD-endopeptidase MepM [Candidatus Kinetoplastibacterium sorsogonicusi]|uniref:Murein DD-endopeptidase MepM n=1 Tax=Candidatus Kinetoplastidibacterium kentomonadis TaxID=1576550 RepID=A0A3S7JAL7_9PROT|nr:peptidoglycan DD-metalloendopeptidase family protein [Candidatus Kinetoplastibacterium sorsogonicusi]AWD32686.1 Murein DD-endopeptidase MepM [Candidatus Kinetoplastibacterium sorsogonicusi]
MNLSFKSLNNIRKKRTSKIYFLIKSFSFVFLILSISILTLITIIVLKENINKNIPDQTMIRNILPMPNNVVCEKISNSSYFVNETTIKKGDNLSKIFERLDISSSDIKQFIRNNHNSKSFHKLLPGRSIQLAQYSDGSIKWLKYIHTPIIDINGKIFTKFLYISNIKKGIYKAEEKTVPTDLQEKIAIGTIKSSFFRATDYSDVPDAVTMQMLDILNSRIDFIRDVRQGDQFRVIYEIYSHEGKYVGSGKVLALEIKNNNKTYNAIWFNSKNNNGSYYDIEGINLRDSFLKSATKFSRISSPFGMRIHPVHKTWTGHRGVDYAAPYGTPIYATANGIVEFSGWQNGYGNVVIIKHPRNYSTVYAHQSHIEKGIKKGIKINQGKLIGYVGSTGTATGPHLHYELRIGNKPVNPLTAKLPTGNKLISSELIEFKKISEKYMNQIKYLSDLQKTVPDLIFNK